MEIGMLWFDADHGQAVDKRIERAAAYYRSKYGRKPNLCFVHPTMTEEGASLGVADLEVKTSVSVLPDHFWLGVDEEQGARENGQSRAAA
jgi:hypothetical protein